MLLQKLVYPQGINEKKVLYIKNVHSNANHH